MSSVKRTTEGAANYPQIEARTEKIDVTHALHSVTEFVLTCPLL